MSGSRFEFGVGDAEKTRVIDEYFSKNYGWLGEYHPIGRLMVHEVRRMGKGGLWLSTAAALVEKESGGRNIFGCDWGSEWVDSPPFCRVVVTRDRVQELLVNIDHGGGQNGVGLTQLTSVEYVLAAEAMGGAHHTRFQMRVGFKLLNRLLGEFDYLNALEAYNDGNGRTNNPDNPYDVDFARLHRGWKNRLSRVTVGDRPTTDVMAVIGEPRQRMGRR